MKSTRRLALVLLTAFCLTGPIRADETADAKKVAAVEKLHRKYVDLTVAGDGEAMGNLMADDFVYIGTEGARNLIPKKQLIKNVKKGILDSVTFGPIKSRVYGDTVILTFSSTEKYSDAKKSRKYYNTVVWVKINGDWKLVSEQQVSE